MNSQDPNDSGVNHNLTTENFSVKVMPVEASEFVEREKRFTKCVSEIRYGSVMDRDASNDRRKESIGNQGS